MIAIMSLPACDSSQNFDVFLPLTEASYSITSPHHSLHVKSWRNSWSWQITSVFLTGWYNQIDIVIHIKTPRKRKWRRVWANQEQHSRTLRTSIGTWAAEGRVVGTLTLIAGVWLTGTLCCMNWAACSFCCCSLRSCSCICSRMSCWRSKMRDVILEELIGGLEAPGCSAELLWENQNARNI